MRYFLITILLLSTIVLYVFVSKHWQPAKTVEGTRIQQPVVNQPTQQKSTLDEVIAGGATTVFDTSPNAFALPAPNLERTEELLFAVGNSFFNQNWVTAPASTKARDGLGPLFNARSCAGCHFKDGRGQPPSENAAASIGFLLRLSVTGKTLHHAPVPEPIYGDQLQDQAIQGVAAEGRVSISYTEISGSFADGIPYTLRQPTYTLTDLAYGEADAEIMLSPRVANQMIGLGLLEAIPEETLLALADPTDKDKDGISGRPNYVWDYYNHHMAIGRFGWKANQPHLLQQVAAAFIGDIGISTSLFAVQNCSPVQTACQQATNGGTPKIDPEIDPEIDDDDLLKVVLYASTLAVPAHRNGQDATVLRGKEIFTQVGCADCHTPKQVTGIHPTIPTLSHQTIYPYSDLLLHEMGAGLADGRPDFQATGSEWRTPPLWGIGLFETVNKHTTYLHDGRARNLIEAILWHGGEAEKAKQEVLQLSKAERDALIAFLNSL